MREKERRNTMTIIELVVSAVLASFILFGLEFEIGFGPIYFSLYFGGLWSIINRYKINKKEDTNK